MDPERIEAALALMKLDEVEELFRAVDLFERSGLMPADEAAEWRRRILARKEFLSLATDREPSG